MDYEKLHKDTITKLQEMVNSGKITVETARGICADFVAESEDEKIRGAIIHFISHTPTVPKGIIGKEIMIAWLEKQGEQKPNDKAINPKFKVGDWIVYKNNIWKICNISLGTYYELLKINNEVSTRTIEDVDKTAHLWTIQDAKDGDVLEFGDHGRLVVGIVSYVNKTTGKVDVNCLLENNTFKVGNYYNLDTIKPHPATQEQRDTLMKAMADAGYTFDSEKKELKKTEQNHTWSEENERMINTVISDLERHGGKEGSCYSAEINFLKSLKGRVGCEANCTTTKEWSEEDENAIQVLKDIVKHSNEIDENIYTMSLKEKLYDWLKSLRLQSHWKPSDEQMKALSDALSLAKNCGEENAFDLRTLYEQLKKLREGKYA